MCVHAFVFSLFCVIECLTSNIIRRGLANLAERNRTVCPLLSFCARDVNVEQSSGAVARQGVSLGVWQVEMSMEHG